MTKSSEKKQCDTSDLKGLLIRLLLPTVALVVSIIARRRGSYGGPISFWILCSFLIIGVLWLWRNKKVEFIKRCILAVPFAPVLPIVLRIVGFDMAFSFHAGIFIFLALVIKADNWRQHFFITLMTAAIFTFLLAYLQRGDLNVYEIPVIFGLGLFFFISYVAYLGALGLQKTIELRPIAVKSFKFAGAIFLLLVACTASQILYLRFHIGFGISFMLCVLFSLVFLGFCYRFKINLSDSSVSNKNKAGKCAFCGRSIYSSEVSHAVKDHTVCGQCYKKIEEEKARIT